MMHVVVCDDACEVCSLCTSDKLQETRIKSRHDGRRSKSLGKPQDSRIKSRHNGRRSELLGKLQGSQESDITSRDDGTQSNS